MGSATLTGEGHGQEFHFSALVYSWGDVSHRVDVASAARPFYAHSFWKAIEVDKIESVDGKAVKWDRRLRNINKELSYKDREIRCRDFANQTSCYQLVEKPDTACADNDWQMALFWDSLFLKVYGATYDTVDEKIFFPLLADAIQCEGQPTLMAFGTRSRTK